MAFTNLLTAMFPVGSVYLSTTATSPSSTIGGTWTQVKGATLAATGGNSFAGGASYGGSLKISVNQIPSHTHYFDALSRYNIASGSGYAAVGADLAADYPDIGRPNMYHVTSVGGGAKLLALPLELLRLVQNGLVSTPFGEVR